MPWINHSEGATNPFGWDFDYSDPGSYVRGSSVFGVQDFIFYNYTLVLDNATNKAT
ncbi:MAG: hypothetical protein ACTSVI_04190 [Promethearchaeota archaeon]